MSKRLQWKQHVAVAVSCFVLFWVTDSFVDALTFKEGPFLAELCSSEPRELYMRTFMSSLLSLFFFVVSSFLERRRNMESALRYSDELSRLFLQSTGDAVCIIDTYSLKITEANPVFAQRYSLSDHEIEGRSVSRLIDSGKLPAEMLSLVEKAAAGAAPSHLEISYLGGDGKMHWEEIAVTPIGDPGERVERVLQVVHDVSMRRSSEALLRESEARYRTIFENTGTAMAIIGPDGLLEMVNQGFELLTGFARGELEGRKRWTDFASGGCSTFSGQWGEQGCACDPLQRCCELQMLHRSGTGRAMAGNWAPIPGTEKAVLSLVDISSQKDAEKALRESQATLAMAQRIANLGNWEWNIAADTLTWSEEMYHMFRVDRASFTPDYDFFLQTVLPEDREMVIRAVNDALYNKKPYHVDYRVTLDGVVYTHTAQAEVTYDGEGHPLRMIGTNQDITSRVAAQQALKTSEEKFSKAFTASPDSIVITRAQDGKYIDVNRAFEETTGYSREEVLGKSSVQLGLWADPEARMVMLRLLNQFGHVRNLDVRFRVKSGEIREMLWSAEVIEYGGEACLIAISRDVTDQRRLEKELLESDARLFMKHEELKNLFHQMEAIRREWEETMDCISDMFILADQWGKIRRFNRAVETFTGKVHRDIVGRDWLPFLEEHGLKPHLESPGVELLHDASGKRLVLKRFAFPTPEVDGSTREVIIINDTTGIRLRRGETALRLAMQR